MATIVRIHLIQRDETNVRAQIEVVKVSNGQDVTVVFDALPDLTLQGTVTAISPAFEEKCGDVTYTVTITKMSHEVDSGLFNGNSHSGRCGYSLTAT